MSRADWAVIDHCLSVSPDVEGCYQAIVDPQVNWLAVFSTANQDFVGPAFWTKLSRPELKCALPRDVSTYLALLYTRNAERNLRIRQQCLGIGVALSSHGLRGVLLKGATWLFDGTTAPASDRMMRDIDLLLPADDVDAAVSALVSTGYQDTSATFIEHGHFDFVEQSHFHYAPLLPRDGEACVEIHRDLAHRTDLLPSHRVIGAAVQVAPGLLLPVRRHRILNNVIHAQIANGDRVAGVFNLRDGLDLARLIDGCGPEFDWLGLAEEAKSRGYFPALSGAIHTAHRNFRSPLPAPFSRDRAGRLHAWRCQNQRHWSLLAGLAAGFGLLKRAFAWDRDAYAFKLGKGRSMKARVQVNVRRARRAYAAVRRLLTRNADPSGPPR